jgi:hypothetical protein
MYNHMVVFISLSDAELDRLFRALADATRRDIVARLLAGEGASVSTLASRYDMSFAAVQKHVAVLEEAGLVTKHRRDASASSGGTRSGSPGRGSSWSSSRASGGSASASSTPCSPIPPDP